MLFSELRGVTGTQVSADSIVHSSSRKPPTSLLGPSLQGWGGVAWTQRHGNLLRPQLCYLETWDKSLGHLTLFRHLQDVNKNAHSFRLPASLGEVDTRL